MISSTSNQKVKRLINLKKKRKFRDLEGVFLVEGIRMTREIPVRLLKEIYVTEGFYQKETALIEELKEKSGAQLEILADHVFAHVSDTKTPQGVLCVAAQLDYQLEDLLYGQAEQDKTPPFLMVLDNLQDPGNLGTIFRSAEAAGVSGILMSSDCVDLYNPKTTRSTMGAIFRMPFLYAEDLGKSIKELKEKGIHTYAAHLEGKNSYDLENYREACAFFIGNEGNGLRKEIADLADSYIRIPMAGSVESLNAAIAATVLMFEAARQRRN